MYISKSLTLPILFLLLVIGKLTSTSSPIQDNKNSNNSSASSFSSSGGIKTFTIKGVTFNMVQVDGGTFMMGATKEQESDAFDEEKPAHNVTLSSYMIGETEVTQELWEAVMGNNPSYYKGAKNPVEKVGWKDCKTFITKLNSLTGQHFRLPTEAEWEFAARGGNKSGHYKFSGGNKIDDVAWYWKNCGERYLNESDEKWDYNKIAKNKSKPHPVAKKKTNELGIYDMSGNVYEWCEDWHAEDYYSRSPQTNPKGPSRGTYHVFRGGSWDDIARGSRVSNRCHALSDTHITCLGFRLAL